MNLTLVDVSCRPLEGTARELEFLYVKGRHVRCALAVWLLPRRGRWRLRQARPAGKECVLPSAGIQLARSSAV